mgnify:CR=1 FL=1
MAVALLGQPKIILLDEPTVGLDPVLRARLWDYFHKLAKSKHSLLVTSHVMDEASKCDEVVLIAKGKILAHGTPKGLIRQHRSENLEQVFIKLTTKGRK